MDCNHTVCAKGVLAQDVNSIDVLAVERACRAMGLEFVRCSHDNLHQYREHLVRGSLPVGSTEFLQSAMIVAGVFEPRWTPFPPFLSAYFRRSISAVRADQVIGKSVAIPFSARGTTDVASNSQLNSEAVSGADIVWKSEFFETDVEWRYWIVNRTVIARGALKNAWNTESRNPDIHLVAEIVTKMWDACGHSFSIDIGRLRDGSTILLSVGDAWASPYIGVHLPETDYLKFLDSRWQNIRQSQAAMFSKPTAFANQFAKM